MFGRKFVAVEILLCKVQFDSVYRRRRTGRKFDAAEKDLALGGQNLNGPKMCKTYSSTLVRRTAIFTVLCCLLCTVPTGLYRQGRCPKGRTCNYLHVFTNPDSAFADMDRSTGGGVPPSSQRQWESSRRGYDRERRPASPNHSYRSSRSRYDDR